MLSSIRYAETEQITEKELDEVDYNPESLRNQLWKDYCSTVHFSENDQDTDSIRKGLLYVSETIIHQAMEMDNFPEEQWKNILSRIRKVEYKIDRIDNILVDHGNRIKLLEATRKEKQYPYNQRVVYEKRWNEYMFLNHPNRWNYKSIKPVLLSQVYLLPDYYIGNPENNSSNSNTIQLDAVSIELNKLKKKMKLDADRNVPENMIQHDTFKRGCRIMPFSAPQV